MGLDPTKSLNYYYDNLGRLTKAETQDVTAANTYRLEWAYDRYGNRLSQSLTGGTISTTAPQLTVSDTTNRITTAGYGYDAAGNLTNDTLHSYAYDAENRIKTLDGVSAGYTYDAAGLRVIKGSTVYVYSGTKVIAEYASGAAATSPSKEYVYSGSSLLATVAAGATTYAYPDHLSTRVEANSSGTVTRPFGPLPFGGIWYETGTASKWKFTSYERDTDTGLDYAIFRSYSSRLGRFMQVDKLAGRIAVPQSLNRYAYVLNDPVGLTDPLGLSDGPQLTPGSARPPCTPSAPEDGDVNEVTCDPAALAGGCAEVYVDGFRTGNTCDNVAMVQDGANVPDCTLNIKINNRANLSDAQIKEIENQIKSLFGPNVGVNFSSEGHSDYTLNIKNAGSDHSDLGHQTDFLFIHFSPVIHPNNIHSNFSREPSGVIDMVMGTVAAHELIHRITGIGDLPDTGHPDDIMAVNTTQTYSGFVNNSLQLTNDERRRLLEECIKRHRTSN